MSADLLRRAASLIHHDVGFGQAHGDDTFLLAVADWLDATADDMGGLHESSWFGPDVAALTVARAYLGEPA